MEITIIFVSNDRRIGVDISSAYHIEKGRIEYRATFSTERGRPVSMAGYGETVEISFSNLVDCHFRKLWNDKVNGMMQQIKFGSKNAAR